MKTKKEGKIPQTSLEFDFRFYYRNFSCHAYYFCCIVSGGLFTYEELYRVEPKFREHKMF